MLRRQEDNTVLLRAVELIIINIFYCSYIIVIYFFIYYSFFTYWVKPSIYLSNILTKKFKYHEEHLPKRQSHNHVKCRSLSGAGQGPLLLLKWTSLWHYLTAARPQLVSQKAPSSITPGSLICLIFRQYLPNIKSIKGNLRMGYIIQHSNKLIFYIYWNTEK